MPARPKQPCRHPNCSELTDKGHCDRHKPQQRERGTAAQRGYDHQWRVFREAYLRKHPLCVDCLADRIITVATEPHHIQKVRDRLDLRLDERNLMALCKPHHQVRTARGE